MHHRTIEPTAEPYLADDGSPALLWEDALAEFVQWATCWLVTTSRDRRPHVVPVLAVVADGAIHVATDPGSHKARNLARDPRATITTHGPRLDLVVEATTARVADAGLAAVTAAYADRHGWEVVARSGALHGDGAPTAGPGPYHVHRLEPARAFAFPTAGDLTPTRWRFPVAG